MSSSSVLSIYVKDDQRDNSSLSACAMARLMWAEADGPFGRQAIAKVELQPGDEVMRTEPLAVYLSAHVFTYR